jgi:hypothetical protein
MSDNTPEYWKNLGNTNVRQKNYDTAIQCYLNALNLDPYYGVAWHNLGVLYEHLGDEKAVKCFETEKEVARRLSQVQAIEVEMRKRTESAERLAERRVYPQYEVRVPEKKYPLLGRVCSLGVALGLVLIVLQLKYSGFFLRGNHGSFSGTTMLIISSGILISLVSFFSYNRLLYGQWCVISPAYTHILKDRYEPPAHKALIVGIIGIGVVMIPVVIYLLLFRAGVNPYGTSDTGIAVIILVVVVFILSGADMLLSWMLTRMKETQGTFSPSYEQLQMRRLARKKLIFFGGFFGSGMVLVTLKSVGVIQDQSVYGTLIIIWLIACFFIFYLYPRFFAGKR